MNNYNILIRVNRLSETEKILRFEKNSWLLVQAETLEQAILKARLSVNFTYKYGKTAKIYHKLDDIL